MIVEGRRVALVRLSFLLVWMGCCWLCGTDMTHIFLSLFLSRHRGCGLLTAYNKVQKLASMQDTSVSLQRRPGSAHSPRPTGPGCREKPRQYV